MPARHKEIRKDINVYEKVKKGDEIKEGQLLGNVAAPTKYFSEEGSNLYFAVEKDGNPVDPMLLIQ